MEWAANYVERCSNVTMEVRVGMKIKRQWTEQQESPEVTGGQQLHPNHGDQKCWCSPNLLKVLLFPNQSSPTPGLQARLGRARGSGCLQVPEESIYSYVTFQIYSLEGDCSSWLGDNVLSKSQDWCQHKTGRHQVRRAEDTQMWASNKRYQSSQKLSAPRPGTAGLLLEAIRRYECLGPMTETELLTSQWSNTQPLKVPPTRSVQGHRSKLQNAATKEEWAKFYLGFLEAAASE